LGIPSISTCWDFHEELYHQRVDSITYLGCEAISTIVVEYDDNCFLHLLLEFHKVWMPHRVENYVKFSSLVDFKYLFQTPT